MLTTKSNARLADLGAVRSDSLLKLITLANADSRADKIDVGVGVYRDGQGRTPVMRAVKAAEKKLWEAQDSKSYLGMRGDVAFAELLRPILLGAHAADRRSVRRGGGCSVEIRTLECANPPRGLRGCEPHFRGA